MTLTILDPRTGVQMTFEVTPRRPVLQPVPAAVIRHPSAPRT